MHFSYHLSNTTLAVTDIDAGVADAHASRCSRFGYLIAASWHGASSPLCCKPACTNEHRTCDCLTRRRQAQVVCQSSISCPAALCLPCSSPSCLFLNHCQQLSRHHHVQRTCTFCSAIDFGLTNHRSWRSRPGSCLLCSTRQTCGPIRLPERTTLATTTSPCINVFAHPPGQATLFSLPTVEPGTLNSHAPPAVSRLAHPLQT